MMFSWFSKKKKEEFVEILGDYDPGDARVEELVGIYSSIKRKIEYANSLLKELEGTSSDDMIGDETAKVKDLIASSYNEINKINLDGSPFEAERLFHEHIVFAKSASLIIPVLIKLDAVDEAKDLFSEIKIGDIRNSLQKKYWQMRSN